MTSGTDLARAVLLDGFQRIEEGVRNVLEGLHADDLVWRPGPGANPVGWLLWHLSRQQDAQLAAIAGEEEVWLAGGWRERFDLPYGPDAHGYGQAVDEVGRFTIEDPSLLTGYAAAVRDLTARLLASLGEEDYARVVDDSWDPPVTAAVRIYSVLEDAAKHLGQAEYVKGLLLAGRDAPSRRSP
ncbi:mycothiol transferase [Ornithinimicrobium flavum]|uniref:mycothiol transferase n=1 Tax=Ornithinimicrobium flavum TaxID=1288636 RepID=UPI00107048E8|nr:DinB family protein [Ornithinimicrobium flavum]